MSKSTPLNQLPLGTPPQYSNDSSRQVVSNTQPPLLPQPTTQMVQDNGENENSIQDLLNELSGNNSQIQQQPQQQPMPMTMPQMPQQPQMIIDTPQQFPVPSDPMMMQDMASMASPSQFGGIQAPVSYDARAKYLTALLGWNNDLKIALFAIGIYIIITIIPFEKYVYSYIALDKIPHSGTIIKAVLGGIALLVLLKMIN